MSNMQKALYLVMALAAVFPIAFSVARAAAG